MFAKTLELAQSSEAKRTMYTRLVLGAVTIGVLAKTIWFARIGPLQQRGLVDFDDFHIVAQRVWLGDVHQAYQLDKLFQMQREMFGATNFLPWTYPPQFNVLIAPLALLPIGLAYFLFTAATLAFFLVTLRAIAGRAFALVLVVTFPALAVTLSCGQNGFLTAGLIGLICLNVEKRDASGQVFAGLALAAMVIKPHLAVAMAVYLLITRRWVTLLTAAIGVLASSVLCTLLFGPQIWPALFDAVRASASYLERGSYPLFRMISSYAALHTLGVAPALAFWGQAICAGLALLAIGVAVARKLSPRTALGVAALVSVMISPYAYDYDLPIVGIGLALLIPDLTRAASSAERGIIYALILVAGAYGMLETAGLKVSQGAHHAVKHQMIPAVGAFAVVLLLALILRILLRRCHDTRGTQDQSVVLHNAGHPL
ncbi:glycosyltransferase family 87 protein [Bradyrhizobium sp. Ec3.3]|uniref:glycosyltransferase family 87 protein n=1 Tax=Bradyrhizobium sp. Ec3.3 TaxID=189753 RepID=UPI00041C4A49|nr:glycosyltransferase family 87 protein [Bradyrhizobium sp. Ec3.3]